MTDCWINMMPRGVTHGLHLHPLSTISGTYYVRTPKGVPGLKLEDPRLDRFMAAPPRRADAGQQPWVTMPVAAGSLPAVRELAPARSAAQHGRRRACQHQLQLQLVLNCNGRGVQP